MWLGLAIRARECVRIQTKRTAQRAATGMPVRRQIPARVEPVRAVTLWCVRHRINAMTQGPVIRLLGNVRTLQKRMAHPVVTETRVRKRIHVRAERVRAAMVWCVRRRINAMWRAHVIRVRECVRIQTKRMALRVVTGMRVRKRTHARAERAREVTLSYVRP